MVMGERDDSLCEAYERLVEARKIADAVRTTFKDLNVDVVTAMLTISLIDQEHEEMSPNTYRICTRAVTKFMSDQKTIQ